MTTLWVAILGVALASAAMKAVGPVLIGGKELPRGAGAVIALLAPSLRPWWSQIPSARTAIPRSTRGPSGWGWRR